MNEVNNNQNLNDTHKMQTINLRLISTAPHTNVAQHLKSTDSNNFCSIIKNCAKDVGKLAWNTGSTLIKFSVSGTSKTVSLIGAAYLVYRTMLVLSDIVTQVAGIPDQNLIIRGTRLLELGTTFFTAGSALNNYVNPANKVDQNLLAPQQQEKLASSCAAFYNAEHLAQISPCTSKSNDLIISVQYNQTPSVSVTQAVNI